MSPEVNDLIMYQKHPYEGVQLVSYVAEGAVWGMVDILSRITGCYTSAAGWGSRPQKGNKAGILAYLTPTCIA